MKIITPGVYSGRIFRFKCSKCGCVYEATTDECYIKADFAFDAAIAKCPMTFCEHINSAPIYGYANQRKDQ